MRTGVQTLCGCVAREVAVVPGSLPEGHWSLQVEVAQQHCPCCLSSAHWLAVLCTLSRPISPSAFLRCPRRPLCTVPVHSLTPSHSVSLIFHWFLVTGTSMCQNSPGVCGGQTSHDRVWEDCARICVSTSRTPWERSLPALPCVPAAWAGAGLDLHV